jgi:hypothetical protein
MSVKLALNVQLAHEVSGSGGSNFSVSWATSAKPRHGVVVASMEETIFASPLVLVRVSFLGVRSSGMRVRAAMVSLARVVEGLSTEAPTMLTAF